METSFVVKPKKWNKYYQKHFSSSSELYSAKLFWCFEAFLRKLTEKKTLLSQKTDYLKKNLRIMQNIFFQTSLKGDESWVNVLIEENKFFGQTSKIGQIFPKMVFLFKMSNIELN